MDWDFPGLSAAVHVDGTLNDDRDIDRGWTVELAFPWKGMEVLAQGRPLPPKDGDVWRMDFSRFEALRAGGVRVQPDPGLGPESDTESMIRIFPNVSPSSISPDHS